MAKTPLTTENLDKVVGGSGFRQGTAGNDVMTGDSGQDVLIAGAGNDVVNGGGGADQLYGDAGNDRLDGGAADRAADLAFGGAGNDSFVWAPGDGNDQFYGEAGKDTLNLSTMSLDQLQSSLQLEGGQNLEMRVNSLGTVDFVNSQGQPQTVQGSITVGGETLRFFGVENLQIKF